MTSDEVLTKIEQAGIVAILRKIPPARVEPVVEGLIQGGITIIEITADSADALTTIHSLNRTFKDQILIGAGTVLDAQTVRRAADAGAAFALSPGLSEDMVTACHDLGLLAVPGCFTPTEIMQALRLKAALIKLFPVGSVGAKYMKDVRAPLSAAKLLPTGGIDLSNVGSFIEAGATAVGLGSSLINAENSRDARPDEIAARARAYVDAVAAARRTAR